MKPGSHGDARYRIGAVASATGISAETLRVWERRYGGLRPARTSAGGRLYSDDDVERLRTIKQLLDRGHGISQLANLPVAELRGILTRHDDGDDEGAPRFDRLRSRFVDAILRLDLLNAEQILARAAAVLDTRTLTLQVVVPVLKTIGDRWAGGTARVCHEHAASGIIRSILGALLNTAPRPSGRYPGPVVVATLAGELHEFGALIAALLAVSAGWQVAYLGPNLPATEVCAAAAATRAQLLLLSVVNPVQGEAAGELAVLRKELPASVRLIAGGPNATNVQQLIPSATVLSDMAALVDLLDRELDNRIGGEEHVTR